MLAFLLIALSLIPFLPAFHGEFLYDDPQLFLDGPPAGTYRTLKAFNHDARSMVHFFDSLLWRLFKVNVTGMDAPGTTIVQPSWPWHFLSLLLHLGTVFCVWSLTGHWLQPWQSFVASAIFACHPLQVSAVGYISGRAGIQAAFFSAMGLLHASLGGWHWLAVPLSQYFAWKSKQDALLYLALYPVILWFVK